MSGTTKMKRTPLIRRTPLKRKTPLKPVSKKRAKLNRKVNPERKALTEFVGRCMVEGCPNDAVECHEITRGFGREAALQTPRLQMPVCRKHHKQFDDYSKWPPQRQLVHRALWELRQMVSEFNDARGRASTDYTVEDLIGGLMFRKRAKR
jgi:hypothetical protein